MRTLCVALVALAACDRQKPLTGPSVHPWASWPVGTNAEFLVRIGDKEWTERWELVAVNADHARIRITSAGRPTDEQAISVREEPFEGRGGEEIVAAGRSFRCRKEERARQKRWICDDLPAWPVRQEDEEGKTVLVAIGERVQNRACMVFETAREAGGTTRRWKSLDVPGHVVRETSRTEIGAHSVDLVRFSAAR